MYILDGRPYSEYTVTDGNWHCRAGSANDVTPSQPCCKRPEHPPLFCGFGVSTLQSMALIAAFKLPSTRTGVLRHRAGVSSRPSRSLPATDQLNGDAGNTDHSSIRPSKHTPRPLQLLRGSVAPGGPLRPLRLIRQDLHNLRRRYPSDWTLFNQLVLASAVYVFFTNLLPGITFASDLYVLTGQNWGTVEVVFSTGLCGLLFSMSVASIPWRRVLRLPVGFRWYMEDTISSMSFANVLECVVSSIPI